MSSQERAIFSLGHHHFIKILSTILVNFPLLKIFCVGVGVGVGVGFVIVIVIVIVVIIIIIIVIFPITLYKLDHRLLKLLSLLSL